MNECVFASAKDERPKGDEPMYECIHGKLLTRATARRLLGLPADRQEEEKKAGAK